jgi:hypothetical protein
VSVHMQGVSIVATIVKHQPNSGSLP